MDRRKFTKILGLSSFFLETGCRRPELFHINKVRQDYSTTYENILEYKTNFLFGNFPVGIKVKTYENVPFHISKDEFNTFNFGVVPRSILGSLYNLYDKNRLKSPIVKGKEVDLSFALDNLFNEISKTITHKGKVSFFLPFFNSPFLHFLIHEIEQYTDAIKFIALPIFDYFSSQFISNKTAFNKEFYILYDISETNIVINFGRDFLEHDPLFPYYTSRYANKTEKTLITFEDNLSLTGANSKIRFPIQLESAESIGLAILKSVIQNNPKQELFNSFIVVFNDFPLPDIPESLIQLLKTNLKNTSFICNDFHSPALQIITFLLNYLSTENLYSDTFNRFNFFDLQNYRDNQEKFYSLINEADKYEQFIFLGYNPFFSLNSTLIELIQNHPRAKISTFSLYKNALTEISTINIPLQHYLEYWFDIKNYDEKICSQQPVILPLIKDSISIPDFVFRLKKFFTSSSDENSYEISLLNFYKKFYSETNEFQKNIQNGYFYSGTNEGERELKSFYFFSILKYLKQELMKKSKSREKLRIIPNQDTYAGEYSNNIYLYELPTTLDGIVWDTPVILSESLAKQKGIENEELVQITFDDNKNLILPCIVKDEIVDNLAYIVYRNHYYLQKNFRKNTFENEITIGWKSNNLLVPNVSINRVGKKFEFARIRRNSTKIDLEKIGTYKINQSQIYPNKIQPEENKWTMLIDVDKCIGCNLCILACQLENNIPVLGKEQIIKQRDLFWINVSSLITRKNKRKFVPIMCQHCDYAPCESVCPVGATSHSPDGINEMTYSRCIGSRFCMANCPYNVRKFNFNNAETSHLNFDPRMMNPFVTLRSRGITEKCSFCIHRINFERAKSKLLGISEFEVTTACQEICPVSAILFGKRKKILSAENNIGELTVLLPEFNTNPNVFYKFKKNE